MMIYKRHATKHNSVPGTQGQLYYIGKEWIMNSMGTRILSWNTDIYFNNVHVSRKSLSLFFPHPSSPSDGCNALTERLKPGWKITWTSEKYLLLSVTICSTKPLTTE